MDSKTLAALAIAFAPLSIVSVGGGASVFAELQHQAVDVHSWVTQGEFGALFAISRAAPGPGALLTTLIGWRAAGWSGALLASLAFFLPSSVFVYVTAHFWNRWRGSAWHDVVENGFVPVAAGLVLASGVTIMQSSGNDRLAWVTAGGVAAGRLWRPNIHPLIWFGVGVILFACGRAFLS